MVNFADEILRDVLARGIVDDEIQLDLISDQNQKMKIEEMIRFVEARESGKRSESRLLETPSVNAASSMYSRNKQHEVRTRGGHDRGRGGHNRGHNRRFEVKCYRCGYDGHIQTDSKCPARDKTCNKCSGIGHFSSMCKTKPANNMNKVRTVSDETAKNTDHVDYAFTVQGGKHLVTTPVNVGGVNIDVLVDSGATCNVVTESMWTEMTRSHVVCTSKKESRTLYAYGTHKLDVVGTFVALTSVGDKSVYAEFIVVRGEDCCLLGRQTSIQLGLLWLKPDVSAVRDGMNTVTEIVQKYEDIFKGVGKLNDFQLKLHMNDNVTPVAQSARRIPYAMRKKVEAKVAELEKMDIIEKVEGPTSWVSPIVIVPKHSGDIRMCVDMRIANTAIERERHPIPTVDEVLSDLNGATVFSKIDLKWGYHQIELSPESRHVTTFTTHTGLYQYKRLMFGINAAPEHYQRIIRNLLQDCDGVQNISDDIIVYGNSQEEHNVRLDRVLTKLKSVGLTANKEKNQIPHATAGMYG